MNWPARGYRSSKQQSWAGIWGQAIWLSSLPSNHCTYHFPTPDCDSPLAIYTPCRPLTRMAESQQQTAYTLESESWLWQLPAVWPWAGLLTSVNLVLPIFIPNDHHFKTTPTKHQPHPSFLDCQPPPDENPVFLSTPQGGPAHAWHSAAACQLSGLKKNFSIYFSIQGFGDLSHSPHSHKQNYAAGPPHWAHGES